MLLCTDKRIDYPAPSETSNLLYIDGPFSVLKALSMDFPFVASTWYAVLTAGLAALIIIYRITHFAVQWTNSVVKHAFLRYILYSTINVFQSQWQPSVLDTLLAVSYLSINGFCMGWGVNSARKLSNRCASLLATNLILALPGANIAADILRISLKRYHRIHSIIGVVALIEGSIHAALELVSQKWNGDFVSLTGLVVSNSCFCS
jgi:hypothetical protein